MALMSANTTLRQWEITTIRTFLIRVAGKLVTSARQLILKTPGDLVYQKEWSAWVAVGSISMTPIVKKLLSILQGEFVLPRKYIQNMLLYKIPVTNRLPTCTGSNSPRKNRRIQFGINRNSAVFEGLSA
uniref:Transposase DDE domain group 1 n=1 Tax=Candidatus Kentrum sp. FM TaxID=2126340 RepID=A0A450TAT0_9GAMM|nr:MAG: Transposase DDE domain group 1 [Candidatus Kentron sp. FM]VFJ65041.1 MAG: Transposase DDE domain group 1 [Candidatus Kentron sp. FM]